MEMRKVGGLEVSLCGLGCNNFGGRVDLEGTRAVVHAALDAGVTFFDTADIYGSTVSERYLGTVLAPRRDDVVIATKFGMQVGDDPTQQGGSARWIARAIEGSLERIGTDRIDLYQLHRPDPDVPIEETLEALDGLVREGKIREIGCSNFAAAQIDEALGTSDARGLARFVTVQNNYSLLHREAEDEVLPACERNGLGFLPYFPLASGMLTGKYRRGEPPPEGTRLAGIPEDRRGRWMSEETFDVVERLEAFAAARGHTPLDLAIAWLASDERIPSVIAGATKPEQVRANAAAVAWRLTPEERAEVGALAPA